jgi:hypothetical protein
MDYLTGANGVQVFKSGVLERMVKEAMRDALQDMAVPTITGLAESMAYYFDESSMDDDDLMLWACEVLEEKGDPDGSL